MCGSVENFFLVALAVNGALSTLSRLKEFSIKYSESKRLEQSAFYNSLIDNLELCQECQSCTDCSCKHCLNDKKCDVDNKKRDHAHQCCEDMRLKLTDTALKSQKNNEKKIAFISSCCVKAAICLFFAIAIMILFGCPNWLTESIWGKILLFIMFMLPLLIMLVGMPGYTWYAWKKKKRKLMENVSFDFCEKAYKAAIATLKENSSETIAELKENSLPDLPSTL